jgi:cell wall-associated NlpC family hydrolase
LPVKPAYLALAGIGAIVAVSGIKGWGVGHTFRDIISGQDPRQNIELTSQITGTEFSDSGSDFGGGTLTGPHADIADYASQFAGKVPYVWGGSSPRTGWDCSGMVNRVLTHFGIKIPFPGMVGHGPVSGQYLFWRGAVTIPRQQCQAGDLVCYPTHIGIATDVNQFVSALNPHEGTTFSAIWAGAKIRRIK